MTCPHCNAPNDAAARFCGVCGRATSSTEPSDPGPTEPRDSAMIGREIAGRYRIQSKLGEGGMGAVFRAEQISLKRTVAVKLLRPEVASSQLLLRRFNAEAEAVAKLSHPNTVNIYDFGQDTDGTLFIAMELIEGRSLRAAIHSEAPFPIRRALAIASQVAASLTDAHSHNIVHRDLKPDNVMLQDRGRVRDVVRVLDFGIAKLRDEGRATQMQMTQAGDMLGTPQYMAPEQIRAETIDGRTDVYALGCMLYEMITARLPYEAPTVLALLSKHLLEQPVPPSQRRPDLGIPPAIDQLILSAMAKDPTARPATMEVFGEHLAALLSTMPADTTQQRPVVAATLAPDAPSFAPRTPPPHVVAPAPTPAAAVAPYLAPAPPMSPPLAAPATFAPPPSSGSSRGAVLVLVGVLVLGGGGVGVWAAMRGPSAEAKVDDAAVLSHDRGKEDDEPESPEVPTPAPAPPPPASDPWSSGGGTMATAIGLLPDGARLLAPPGFEVISDLPAGRVIFDKSKSVMIGMGPISSPSEDPQEIANEWASQQRVRFEQLTTISSHGGERWVASFSGTGKLGPFKQLIIGYVTPDYRIGVVVSAPPALAGQAVFRQWIAEFLERNVRLP